MTSLLDLWKSQRDFLEAKSIIQVIGVAGDGQLRDGNESSLQLREFLANIPSPLIERYVSDCLLRPFQESGFVLQDLINEIGCRLGFDVEPGFYRGGGSRIGFDGIWRAKDGYGFVIEVKTTDAYQLNIDTQAQYRARLVSEGRINEAKSSILVVVGRQDTGGLEAQTRGSRHAWDVRIIGVDALFKLMRVKENLTDARTVTQIQEVLKPLEHTRVDCLIDIIFSASEDLRTEDEAAAEEDANQEEGAPRTPSSPVNYHEDCVARISAYLDLQLVKQDRCTYATADRSTRVLCIVSKEYRDAGATRYWYAFHPSQKEYLDEGRASFIALGCGSANQILLIPLRVFTDRLSEMSTTSLTDRYYWHVKIFRRGGKLLLNKPTKDGVDVTGYLITELPRR